MVTICTSSLTFSNSTFCPHSVFMCFVWIWEQTAIISLYNVNWLVFITETECVYYTVRTASGIIRVSPNFVVALPCLGRLVVGFSARRPGFDPRSTILDLWWTSSKATGFPPWGFVFPFRYHPTNAPYSSSSTCCSYYRIITAKPEKPSTKRCSFENLGSVGLKSTFTFFSHDLMHAKGERNVTSSHREQQSDAVASSTNEGKTRRVNEI